MWVPSMHQGLQTLNPSTKKQFSSFSLAFTFTLFLLAISHPPPPQASAHPLTHTTSKARPHFCFPLLGRRGGGWRARVFSSGTICQGAGKWAGTQLRAAHWVSGVSLNEGPIQRNEVQWIDCGASWNIKEWTDFPQYLYTSLCGDFSLHWAWNC